MKVSGIYDSKGYGIPLVKIAPRIMINNNFRPLGYINILDSEWNRRKNIWPKNENMIIHITDYLNAKDLSLSYRGKDYGT
ncbi:MAG: hypothetical protein ACTSRK_19800 [Promethearchaeota archaeon]